MNRLKYFSISCIIVIAILLLVGCKSKVQIPTNLNVDEDYKLSWDEVADAKKYMVFVEGINVEYSNDKISSNKPYYALSKLDLQEGDYNVKVKAVNRDKKESKWSSVYQFHKAYETGCKYTLINNGTEYEITSGGTSSGNVYIEDYYKGKPITKIGKGAFKSNLKIESVHLGNKIVEIEEFAFSSCKSMVSIELPSSLKVIGKGVFNSCKKLESIKIPDGIEEIAASTFSYCSALTTVSLPDSIKKIGDEAFIGCAAISKLTLPKNLESIGEHTFEGLSGITAIEIPNKIQELPSGSFAKCVALKNVTFAKTNNLKVINDNVFRGCSSLQKIVLPEGLEEIGAVVFDSCESLEEITIPDTVLKVGLRCFAGTKIYADAVSKHERFVYADRWVVACIVDKDNPLTSITKTSFKNGVVGIADNVFQAFGQLSSVVLNSSIKIVGASAFSGCKVLGRFVTEDSSIEIIWDNAFSGCEILSRVVLGEGLQSIGSQAFYGCILLDNNELGDTLIPESVKKIGILAFKGTALSYKPDEYGVIHAGNWVVGVSHPEAIQDVVLDSSVVGIAEYTFSKCINLTTVIGLVNARYIGKGAFYKCEKLQTASLNRNLRTIEDFTFYGCTELFSISLPMNLQTIGESAFRKCYLLNEIDLSNTKVTTIKPFAFYDCPNIKKVKLNNSLETIGDKAFYKNVSLEEIALPDSLKEMGEMVFYGCSGLTTVSFGSGITYIPNYTFYKNVSLKEINLPDTITEVGDYAFYKCSRVEKIDFGHGLKKIGSYAFCDLTKLEELYLPSNIEEISMFAFKGCEKLQSVILSSKISTIGKHAFYGNKMMTIYTDAIEIMDGWNISYNSSKRPVVCGCELSENQEYVVSVKINRNTLQNFNAVNGYSKPQRKGYDFFGWKAINPDGTSVIYSAEDIIKVPLDVEIVALWEEAQEAEIES